jgi:xylose isomerase
MDTMARALLAAASIIESGHLDELRAARYAGWDGELGRHILDSGASLADLHRRQLDRGEPAPVSGRQEMLENLVALHVAQAG